MPSDCELSFDSISNFEDSKEVLDALCSALGSVISRSDKAQPAKADFLPSPMSATIFSKIIRGEIPCHKVYEDAHVLAFLDIGPLSTGHILVIPKEAKATLGELSDESAAALGRVLPRLCRAVMKVTGATAYNVLQNNGAVAHQAVMHVHFHIIPKHDDAAKGPGLGIQWKSQSFDHAAGAALAKQIAASIS